jgi:hypothetical protein
MILDTNITQANSDAFELANFYDIHLAGVLKGKKAVLVKLSVNERWMNILKPSRDSS